MLFMTKCFHFHWNCIFVKYHMTPFSEGALHLILILVTHFLLFNTRKQSLTLILSLNPDSDLFSGYSLLYYNLWQWPEIVWTLDVTTLPATMTRSCLKPGSDRLQATLTIIFLNSGHTPPPPPSGDPDRDWPEFWFWNAIRLRWPEFFWTLVLTAIMQSWTPVVTAIRSTLTRIFWTLVLNANRRHWLILLDISCGSFLNPVPDFNFSGCNRSGDPDMVTVAGESAGREGTNFPEWRRHFGEQKIFYFYFSCSLIFGFT